MTTPKISCVRCPDLDYSDVLCGFPVRGPHFRDAAQVMNYVAACGGQAVPFYTPDRSSSTGPLQISSSGSVELKHWVRRRSTCRARVWAVTAYSSDGVATLEISINGGDGYTFSPPAVDNEDAAPSIVLYEEIVSQADTSEEVEISILNNGASAAYVTAIAAWEMPRGDLDEDNVDFGTALAPFASGRPIRATGIEQLSIGSLDKDRSCRNGFFYWSTDDTGVSFTNAAYADFFEDDFYTIPAKETRSQGSANFKVKIYGKTSAAAGVSLDWRIVTDSGTYTGTSITGTSWTWATELTCQQRTEAMTRANGVQAGHTGQAQLEVKVTGGGTCYLRAVSVYDE